MEDLVVSYTSKVETPVSSDSVIRDFFGGGGLRFCALLGLRFLPTRSLTLVIKPFAFLTFLNNCYAQEQRECENEIGFMSEKKALLADTFSLTPTTARTRDFQIGRRL